MFCNRADTPGAGHGVGFFGRFIGLVLMGVLLGGCSKQDDAQSAAPAVIHSYTTRGRVVMLPDPSNPASELRIRHEAIDDYKYRDGSPAPMKSMTMPFPLGPGVSLEGLAVGDVVGFSFAVQWEPSPGMRVTAIQKLPGDTELEFDVVSQDRSGRGDGANGDPDGS
jgi:Cu/Ag efflux protein CusF